MLSRALDISASQTIFLDIAKSILLKFMLISSISQNPTTQNEFFAFVVRTQANSSALYFNLQWNLALMDTIGTLSSLEKFAL